MNEAMIFLRYVFDNYTIADQPVEMPPYRRFRGNLQQQQMFEAKRRTLLVEIAYFDKEIEILVSFNAGQTIKEIANRF